MAIHCDYNIVLNKVLIFVILLTVLLVPSYKINAKECRDIDIRNSVDNFKNLRGCRYVTGFLQIVLMEKTTENDFKNISFPLLREVTGYFLVYRVFGLTNIGKLFPNLVLIRGLLLQTHYSLMIYDLKDLREVGLKSLMSIQRGNVIIQKCPNICHGSTTIDWNRITPPGAQNSIEIIYPNFCKSKLPCQKCKPAYCWSENICQRFNTSISINGDVECSELCFGGCVNETASGCMACRYASDDGLCVEKCPPTKLLNIENLRCVSHEWCFKMGKITFNDECIDDCPKGYTLIDLNEEKEKQNLTCHVCQNNCPKLCDGTVINYIPDAERLKGCTVILGSLYIKINIDIADLLSELERNLGDIEEIEGFLKVYRSLSITSLAFLRSLTTIRGEELDYGGYALVINENPNLQTLWDWKIKKSLTIETGSMFFHYNYKLCYSEIQTLQRITNYNNDHDLIEKVNGYKLTCDSVLLQTLVMVRSSTSASIYWKKYITDDPSVLLGYIIAYIEAPRTDITPQYGRDTCSKFSWKTIFINKEKLVYAEDHFQFNITQLKPFTQYAYYVKTFTDEKNANISDGQTEVKYFKTLVAAPNLPNVTTIAKTANSITIGWSIDDHQEQLITYFAVEVIHRPDDTEFLKNGRDYCREPPIEEPEPSMYLNNNECNCTTEIFEFEKTEDSSEETSCAENTTDEKKCDYVEYKSNETETRYKRDTILNFNEFNKIQLDGYDFRQSLFDLVDIESFKTKLSQKAIKLNNTLRMYTLTNLKPFTLYTMLFVACNANCSPIFMHTDRTLQSETADLIDFSIRNSTGQIILHFEPPKQPNGLTVAYHIDCMKLDDIPKEGVLCVTHEEHKRKNYNFVFHYLPYGNFGVRIRSVSLAGAGQFTEWKLFQVTAPIPDRTFQHVMVVAAIILGVALMFGVAYKLYCKYYLRTPAVENISLIASMYNPNVDEIAWREMPNDEDEVPRDPATIEDDR